MDLQGNLISDDMWVYGFTMLDTGVILEKELTDSEFRTYAVLKSMVNSKSAVAFPSYDVIAERCGHSTRTAIRNVKRLVDLDLLNKVERKGTSNIYVIKKKQNSKVLMTANDLEEWMRSQSDDTGDAPKTPKIEKPKPPNDERTKDPIPYKDIMDHLNERAGTKFNHKGEANKKLIRARYNELKGKMTHDEIIAEFKKVIDVKVSQWRGGDMEKYLRPVTLFGNKFDQYRNESPTQKKSATATDGGDDWKTKFLGESD